ncbi:hypothetical protein F2Q70_00025293 [Brassica cretica]|uniref:Radical SAM core domain-containing protein n=1 Tax=Brassica cretica TaxID=69181 RepID=A0A8S9L7N4_BRACR|nr:hypothetical protein F2Q70_00025293 [Brassica cretica]
MRMCLFKINDWQVAFTNLNCFLNGQRCNLRCQYCRPSEGVELTPKPQFLSQSDIVSKAIFDANVLSTCDGGIE